jgi:glutamyl/glutaminyl-tRNA synthetase
VFGQKPPVFMHLPVITGKDGKKLSKRDPTAPIKDIIDKGYQK